MHWAGFKLRARLDFFYFFTSQFQLLLSFSALFLYLFFVGRRVRFSLWQKQGLTWPPFLSEVNRNRVRSFTVPPTSWYMDWTVIDIFSRMRDDCSDDKCKMPTLLDVKERYLCRGLAHLCQIIIHFKHSLFQDLFWIFYRAQYRICIWLDYPS